jgi:hypothetical protein
MTGNRGSRLSVAAAVLIVTLGTLVGIAQAAPAPPRPAGCNPDGRFICISIEDVDDVSHSEGAPSSVGAIDRYTEYTVLVSNGGSAALTNGSAKVDLNDLLAGDIVSATTQGQFVAAPSGCTPSGASTSFTCSLPNLGASGVATLHFFARTSTNTSADAMRLTVLASFKESASDSEGPAAQTDTFSVPERTSLEPNPEFSASVYFAGSQNVVLATTPGAGGQSSVFRVPSTVGFSIAQLVTLKEISSGETGYFCPVAACFGQSVATSAPGIFTATNPANVVTTLNAALLPNGVTEKSLVVHHTGSASFTTACSGALFTQPAASQVLPCRRVVIDKKAGIVTIDSWDNHQGDWGFS